MRVLFVPLCLLVAGSVRVCGNEEKSSAGVAGSAEALRAPVASAEPNAVLPRARIGGSVASAGDLSVEVALHEGGRVEALVSDAKGLPINEGVKLSALVQAAGGASENVELAFVPARARFEGQSKAGVELAPGPVAISVEAGGKVHRCKLGVGVVLPRPKVGGQVLAAGDFSAEVLAHRGGEVQAFVHDRAGAEVKANASASFLVRCRAKGGGMEEVALHFDAPRSCFAGKAKAGVELEPGPLEFVVDAKVGAGIGGLERIALMVDASHGGQLVTVGDYSLELVAKGGELKAFAFDASGKVQSAGDLDVRLDVGADNATKLALAWDAPCLCYKANVAGNSNLALQPIGVSLVAGGKAFFGAVTSLQAAGKANLRANAKLDDANANVDANAKLGPSAKLAAQASATVDPKLDAKASAGAAKGASATVKVTPPKVSVTTNSDATSGAKAGGGAKASAGFSFGTK